MIYKYSAFSTPPLKVMSEIKNDTNELEANVMKLKASMKKVARSIE